MFSPPQLKAVPPREFKIPEGTRIYAVGDIHGRSALLSKMFAAIAKDVANKPPATITEIFLGDYIDRGMQSREVIDLLIAPPPTGHQRVCLMGNHEDTLLRFLVTPSLLREWANFGGYATLASYGLGIPESMSPEKLTIVRDRLIRDLPESHMTFLQNLKLSYQMGDYLFVHAGILPETPLEEQSRDNLLWIRAPFLKHEGYFDHYIVHGHSPVEEPDIRPNRANLDVSGATKDTLCCLVIEGSNREVIQVSHEKD